MFLLAQNPFFKEIPVNKVLKKTRKGKVTSIQYAENKSFVVAVSYDDISELFYFTPDNRKVALQLNVNGSESQPYLSRSNGRYVVFTVSDQFQLTDIYMADVEKRIMAQVTGTIKNEFNPSICNDGSRIVYEIGSDPENPDMHSNIILFITNGGEQIQVTDKNKNKQACISGDGTKILYKETTFDEKEYLVMYDIQNKTSENIQTGKEGQFGYLSTNFNGEYILFSKFNDSG
ncbi:MAG: hypothetical protein C0594_09915 [Marinilabiliales bacterium]|nr:MAG: hypothetical protein C0594_09915 [Marinilabiliales bacterium]